MAAGNGDYDALELVALTTSRSIMDDGMEVLDFNEPAYSRYELYWLMIHNKPESRIEAFDAALSIYASKVYSLAEFALIASSNAVHEAGLTMRPVQMAYQVSGLICAREAVAGHNLMYDWFNHIEGIEHPKDYDRIDVVGRGTLGIHYDNFQNFLDMSEKNSSDPLFYQHAMRASVNFTLMTVLQQHEQTIAAMTTE